MRPSTFDPQAISEPFRLDVSRPFPGIDQVRIATDGRLFTSVKDRFATVMSQRGHSEWTALGRTWESGPGNVQLKAPGDVHRDLRRDGPAAFTVLLFDDALVTSARAALERPFAAPTTAVLQPSQSWALAQLHALALASNRIDPLALDSAVTEALHALVNLTSRPGSGPARVVRRAVRRALDFIDERFMTALSLDELADHADLDKFHLVRAFREEVGLPPYAYITHRRLARAQTWLGQGVAAAEVAQRVGFYDQSQLNRHFKRLYGLTPVQFARSVR